MKSIFSIIELDNTTSNQYALHNLLISMDGLFKPKLSSQVDLLEYSIKLLGNGKVFCSLTEQGEYVGLLAMYANDSVNRNAFISYIGVFPEFQGTGISSNLIAKAIEVAAGNEMKTISLEVSLYNHRAINFYKKHRFYESERTIYTLLMKKDILEDHKTLLPLVTVSCMAYNHVAYIRDALKSFLMQKTTFSIEILVHDDGSIDGTAEIIREYEKRYPDKIFPVYQRENQYSKGVNIFAAFQLPRARGKYIALCEGDDYWVDPLKLEKQIEIMKKYPDTIICGARAITWSEKNKRFSHITPALDKEISCMTPKKFFYLGDWVKNCTRVISRELMTSIPVNFLRDYRFVHFLLAKNPAGTFRCLDEVVAVYREHAGGVFSGANPIEVLEYNFESKVLLAGLFSDDRLYSMRERAAETAKQLTQTRSLSFKKRLSYAWQYIYLLYGDFSISGNKRTLTRALDSWALRFGKYPRIKQFLKPFASFIRQRFLRS